MKTPPIVSPQDWEAAREKLLVKEKELTRALDAMAAERRRMPWMAVDKDYRFEGPNGPASLADLFDGRRQLIVYRAFYAPDVTTYPASWRRLPGAGHRLLLRRRPGRTSGPSERAGHDAGVCLARPSGRDPGFEAAHGLGTHPWYTLTDDFDKDFGVDLWHGHNAFIREGDRIFRTYFVNARGDSHLGTTWSHLDITALGRQEEWEDSPEGLSADPAVPVVELPRRVRRGRVIPHVRGAARPGRFSLRPLAVAPPRCQGSCAVRSP